MSDSRTKSETFLVPALHCSEEFALIHRGLAPLQGVQQVVPNYVHRSLRVEYDPEYLDQVAIADRLRHIGFPPQAASSRSARQSVEVPRLRATTLAGGAALLAAFLLWWIRPDTVWVPALAITSTLLSGWPVAWAALRALRLGRMDMNALMTIAATGAIAIGYWFEAATTMFLFGVALWLESYSMGRARRAVQTLVELTPTVAHRLVRSPLVQLSGTPSEDTNQWGSADRIVDVDPSEVAVGELVLVKPGERVPLDGSVVEGYSTVNQAPITGESMPIEKSPGNVVFAGTLNNEGALVMRAEKTAEHSTLAHVARLVEQAQAARSPTERFVDRFAQRYTPAVILLAVVIALGLPLLGTLGVQWAAQVAFVDWLHRGLVLLVIACPCALVISTPLTIVCGLHQATRYGMLVKGGQYLETAAHVDCIAIDKTGTLTLGQPHVVEVQPGPGQSEAEVLRIAAALEAQSEHPLAAAIVAAANQSAANPQELGWPAVSDFQALRGFGVRGTVEGKTYYVASPRFFQQEGLGGQDLTEPWETADSGYTTALVGTAERLLGAIYLADQPREDAAQAIAELKRLGVPHVVMLTGDSYAVARQIGKAVGIDEIYAELLPDDKVSQVQMLASRYRNLAMVGDGVNDAPALAASQLGIALGSQSSDTALETADVAVMAPHLTRIPLLIKLSRRTRRILGLNIFLALTIKAAVLLLAAAGIATMWMAVAADVGASLLVIFNGMRLLTDRNPPSDK